VLVASDVLDIHGRPWRERGRPDIERLPKSKREVVGVSSWGGRNAVGGGGSNRSVALENRPRVVEEDLVDGPDGEGLYVD
jgi:hypothetical protein